MLCSCQSLKEEKKEGVFCFVDFFKGGGEKM